MKQPVTTPIFSHEYLEQKLEERANARRLRLADQAEQLRHDISGGHQAQAPESKLTR